MSALMDGLAALTDHSGIGENSISHHRKSNRFVGPLQNVPGIT